MEKDVLGTPYEALTLTLPDDDEGEVVATLVRRRAEQPTRRAVLYVHGWMDYFFQTNLADHFVERGFDFYALDLRKYGRSIREHQTAYFCRDVSEYFAEIDEALRIIRDEDDHDTVLLNAHSTGGLTTSLWAHEHRGEGLVQGLYLNSPFFDLNAPWLARTILADAVSVVARFTPRTALPLDLPSLYGRSLHRDHDGEWDFSLDWKPVGRVPLLIGWIAAMRNAHRRVQGGLAIDVPVLVHCSTESFHGRTWDERIKQADAVLNVEHIARWAPRIGPDVTLVRIEGAIHDVVLSSEPVRKSVFADLDKWLDANLLQP
jgi:alpha-beta hydrolase superfamily lysophospholipase